MTFTPILYSSHTKNMMISNLVTRAGNEAIEINPPSGNVDIHLTKEGSDWLWAAFAIFAAFSLAHTVLYATTSSAKQSLKKFLTLVPLFTNAIMAYTYFTYASDLGWTETATEFKHVTTSEHLGVRQVFYVKYIGWFLAWPFVLLATEVATSPLELKYDSTDELLTKVFNLFSGLFAKILSTEIYVIGLLIGILIPSTYKWGYYTFAVSAQLFAIALVANSLFKTRGNSEASKLGSGLVLAHLVIWILYPICWGVSEGGNKIQPDSEAVFYGILDVINFGVLPSVLTFVNVRGIDEGFFHKIFHRHEKESSTPRQSGETAV